MMHKKVRSYSILEGLQENRMEKVYEGGKDVVLNVPDVPKGNVRIFYSNLSKNDFMEEHKQFFKKVKKFLTLTLGKDDDISNNIRAYIEVSEVVGQGQVLDLYIYGFREECNDIYNFKDVYGSKNEFLKKFSKLVNHFVGTPSEIEAAVLWKAKIEIKRRPVEVGPFLHYAFNEEAMGVEDYKKNREEMNNEDEE